MYQYDAIIFDLDGTLWDASEPCADGWNTALRSSGLAQIKITADDIRSHSGLTFAECVSSLFGGIKSVDIARLAAAIEAEEKCCVEKSGGVFFQGVKAGLDVLSDKYSLFLVSNCQSWYLRSFWSHSSLRPFFQGNDCHGDSGQPKSEMIARITEQYQLSRPIYIGDTIGDQQAAKEVGVSFGYVDYGFGEAYEPELSFSSFNQLTAWFLNANIA